MKVALFSLFKVSTFTRWVLQSKADVSKGLSDETTKDEVYLKNLASKCTQQRGRKYNLFSNIFELISQKVCISILHDPGDDQYGYEKASERWLPVHTVEVRFGLFETFCIKLTFSDHFGIGNFNVGRSK